MYKSKKRSVHNRWTLSYIRDAESINHSFFGALRPVGIGSVLHYVNQHCQFIEAFDHILGRYAKQIKVDQVLIACLLAWGTNMGLGRIIIGKLSAYARKNKTKRALWEYDNIIKSLYFLDYIDSTTTSKCAANLEPR